MPPSRLSLFYLSTKPDHILPYNTTSFFEHAIRPHSPLIYRTQCLLKITRVGYNRLRTLIEHEAFLIYALCPQTRKLDDGPFANG